MTTDLQKALIEGEESGPSQSYDAKSHLKTLKAETEREQASLIQTLYARIKDLKSSNSDLKSHLETAEQEHNRLKKELDFSERFGIVLIAIIIVGIFAMTLT